MKKYSDERNQFFFSFSVIFTKNTGKNVFAFWVCGKGEGVRGVNFILAHSVQNVDLLSTSYAVNEE